MNKYPARISTMIDAEMVARLYPITINEIVEEIFAGKKYVLYLGIFILECLVFDEHDVLIDSYSLESTGESYNNKTFLEWMYGNEHNEIPR